VLVSDVILCINFTSKVPQTGKTGKDFSAKGICSAGATSKEGVFEEFFRFSVSLFFVG
jgi:hypothetical protein